MAFPKLIITMLFFPLLRAARDEFWLIIYVAFNYGREIMRRCKTRKRYQSANKSDNNGNSSQNILPHCFQRASSLSNYISIKSTSSISKSPSSWFREFEIVSLDNAPWKRFRTFAQRNEIFLIKIEGKHSFLVNRIAFWCKFRLLLLFVSETEKIWRLSICPCSRPPPPLKYFSIKINNEDVDKLCSQFVTETSEGSS